MGAVRGEERRRNLNTQTLVAVSAFWIMNRCFEATLPEARLDLRSSQVLAVRMASV